MIIKTSHRSNHAPNTEFFVSHTFSHYSLITFSWEEMRFFGIISYSFFLILYCFCRMYNKPSTREHNSCNEVRALRAKWGAAVEPSQPSKKKIHWTASSRLQIGVIRMRETDQPEKRQYRKGWWWWTYRCSCGSATFRGNSPKHFLMHVISMDNSMNDYKKWFIEQKT